MRSAWIWFGLAAMVLLAGGGAVAYKARGLRNNNPGNLRHGPKWDGLRETQTDPEFAQFVSMEYGFRALAITLLNYQRLHGLNTVRGIINRYAPPSENDTGAYVAHVAKALGVGPDEVIDVRDYLGPLVEVITRHENGAAAAAMVPASTMVAGLRMAGVEIA